jgi:hypothetical protein
MLYVSFGDVGTDCIETVNATFNYRKKPEWFNRDDVKRIIKNIDKTEVIEDECLKSPVLGTIAPERLSTGCKAVILMLMYSGKRKVYATKCGDNCAPEILNLAKNMDISIVLHHVMEFPEPFEMTIEESGHVVTNMKDFISEFYKYKKVY